jgi:predicted nucleic acid-binding protein
MRIFVDINIVDDVDDFEDALQIECAKEFNADYVITRDLLGFSSSGIEVISPIDFIKTFGG